MLFELLLGATVVLLITVWASQALVNRINDASAQHNASWMLMIRHGVYSYLERHESRLRQAAAPGDLLMQGYQDWAAPSLSELKATGLLAAGFPEYVRPADSARVRVLREGDCPGDACRIGAVIYSQKAFLKRTGAVDEQMLAQWLLSTKGLGGIVHPSQPGMIRGQTFQYQNPLQGGVVLPIGTVVMAISNDQLNDSAYLRVRDRRDPQFQSDMTVEGNIAAGDDLSVGNHLYLNAKAQWLGDCMSEGAIGRDEQHGLLLCSGGVWKSASRSSGGYSTNTIHGCFTPEGKSSANPVTASCSCPWGYASVPISEGGDADTTRGMTRGYLCVRK